MCYLPTWPFFKGGSGGMPPRLPPPDRYRHFDWSLLPSNRDSDDEDDSIKPQPRCIQRVEFQTPVSVYKV